MNSEAEKSEISHLILYKMLEYTIEKSVIDEGYKIVCGIDEAGRGPLCGPVVAAACIIPLGLEIPGLNDSKKLTAKKREVLFDIIKKEALAYCIAESSVEEIDSANILEATLQAMRRAVDGLNISPDYILVDGNIFRGFDRPGRCVIGGDATSPSIAAASILAKVTRDRMCVELDRQYPMYGIAKNKGYGTKDHMNALRQFGPSPIHRKKFIRFLDE